MSKVDVSTNRIYIHNIVKENSCCSLCQGRNIARTMLSMQIWLSQYLIQYNICKLSNTKMSNLLPKFCKLLVWFILAQGALESSGS